MNLDIKQRIEQIESGEVPNGYIKKYKYVFPNTWNLVNLGSVTKRKSEKNKNRNDLKSYSINNQVGFIQQDEQFSEGSYQDVDKTNYKVVKPGEFAYNPARINIGSIGLQKEDADVIISSLYVCFGLDKSYSKTYFENWFKSYDFNKEITRNLEGSVREYLFYENFSNIKLPIPSLAEQEKIAEILMQCDKLIELYQNETDELQKMKKVYLSKMFPKKGENIPESRFPQFTDSWEQRKLGDVVQITMGQSPDGSTYSDEPSDYILVQGNADLQNGWVCPRIWTTQITKKADAGDLIMSVRAPAGAMGKTAYNAVIGRGVAAIKGNEFIYQLLVKMDMDGFWKTLSCGSTFESLNSDNIKNAEVKVPTTAEQVQIGDFFRHLDNLITLHQHKLEEMKKYKKSLMQLLLTGIVRV